MVTLYQDCSSNCDSSKYMAARGRGLFSLCIYIKKFKNFLLRNRLTEFNVTWQECCFGDPLPRLFKPSWYIKKHGPRGWGLFSIYICIENFKILLVKYLLTDFNNALVTLYQECSSNPDMSKKTWLLGGGAYFPYRSKQKTLKSLLVRNHWTDFNLTWQECSFGYPLPSFFKVSWFIKKKKKKMSLRGLGFIAI